MFWKFDMVFHVQKPMFDKLLLSDNNCHHFWMILATISIVHH